MIISSINAAMLESAGSSISPKGFNHDRNFDRAIRGECNIGHQLFSSPVSDLHFITGLQVDHKNFCFASKLT